MDKAVKGLLGFGAMFLLVYIGSRFGFYAGALTLLFAIVTGYVSSYQRDNQAS